MTPFSKRTGTIVAALILSLLVAACGSGGEAEATPFPTPTALPAVAEDAPASGEESAAEAPAAEAPAAEAGQPESPLSPLATPTPVPVPTSIADGIEITAGLSSVVGRAVDSTTGEPIIAFDIRLAEVYCPDDVQEEEKTERCFWAIDDARSPYTQTMADGVFKFLNVEARDYAILLGSALGSYSLSEREDGKAVIYSAPADEVLDVGEITLKTP